MAVQIKLRNKEELLPFAEGLAGMQAHDVEAALQLYILDEIVSCRKLLEKIEELQPFPEFKE